MNLTSPISISGFTVSSLMPRYNDDTQAKIVTMTSARMIRPLVLWRDDAYTEIGDWTNAQAQARIQALADSGALAACYTT